MLLVHDMGPSRLIISRLYAHIFNLALQTWPQSCTLNARCRACKCVSMSQATTFVVAFAAVFGAAESIRNTQAQARRKEHRSRKNNLIVHCLKSSQYSSILEGRHIVLSGDQVRVKLCHGSIAMED
jgi:hypothetical protein